MSMEKNNSIVEEALLQMKAVEDAINENAKGILASTMKEEISELVRESLGGSKKSKKSRKSKKHKSKKSRKSRKVNKSRKSRKPKKSRKQSHYKSLFGKTLKRHTKTI